MKDPFEAACEEQESPPESPVPPEEDGNPVAGGRGEPEGGEEEADEQLLADAGPTPAPAADGTGKGGLGRAKEEDEEEEDEEHMDVDIGRFPSGDPDKVSKMQAILSQFTVEQMGRYESFRRSNFQKSNMRRLLTSITGSQKISMPLTIVVSGIAKIFVGELVETGKIVMSERKETGPIRPCHIREAYRRLKLDGKIPKKSVPRLFQ